ncbi:hypothetical protein BT93_L4399 [Corymbia citriodora subsp. variegata]|uniref:Cotton fiber protein n=1 Tax=Corymbia citriodora subsp. variegata TaxID=360336 RepID=A0A8T0CVJ3_CORYI|nr:hypothetical protein BT93_L4399 [Corymbia citriodora subsp. variegata]
MARKTSGISRRAWNLLRLALLWARKGGAFKLQLRLVPKFLKTIGQATPRGQIWYGERELSFDKTPVIHVKMHRLGSMRFHLPNIPCINPPVDFDPEFDDDDHDRLCYGYDTVRTSFLENGGAEETRFDEEDDGRMEIEEEQGIDTRAEEFIAKFYEQMKLQRQISRLQYNEMLNRGAS